MGFHCILDGIWQVLDLSELGYFRYLCCYIYFFWSFGTFESRKALNPVLGGVRDDASVIISHEQTSLLFSIYANSFRVTEENLVFETVQSGPYSSFECFLCSYRSSLLYFICCHCSWCCAVWQP